MAFTNPTKNLSSIGIIEGMRVADFGCGPGAYSFAVSEKVGTSGKVYAIDIQQELLTRLAKEAENVGITNLYVVRGDLEVEGGSTLPDSSCDVVIISNLLFQIDNKNLFLVEANRILTNEGRVLFIEWSDSFSNTGPHKDNVIPKEKAIALFTDAGFILEREFDAGDHHYGIIFNKS